MPRPKSDVVREYYKRCVEKNVYICQIPIGMRQNVNEDDPDDVAPICGVKIKGDHSMTLERHIQSQHLATYNKLQEKKCAQSEITQKRKDKPGSSSSGPNAKRTQTTLDAFAKGRITMDISPNFLEKVLLISSTVDGRPLSMVHDTSMQMLLERIYSGFKKHRIPFKTQSRHRTRELILQNYENIKSELSRIIENRIISLKVDCVARHCRCFFGINLQFIHNNEIVSFTLGVIETKTSQTGAMLKKLILDVCSEYGILPANIYSVTTDNGSNMVKMVQLLNTEIQLQANQNASQSPNSNSLTTASTENSADVASTANSSAIAAGAANSSAIASAASSTDDIEMENSSSDQPNDNDSEYDDEFSICDVEVTEIDSDPDDPDADYFNVSVNTNSAEADKNDYESIEAELKTLSEIWPDNFDASVIGIKCAAHSMNLAIQDTWNDSSGQKLKKLMDKVRTMVKKMRTKNLIHNFKLKPILDCKIRWTSGDAMLTRFLELKEDIQKVALREQEFYLPDSQWDKIKALSDALAPCKKAMIQLQKSDITLPECYKVWSICIIETGKINHPLAKLLAEKLDTRKKLVYSNVTLLTALYLDPRYKALLKIEQKVKVRAHLRALQPTLHKDSPNVTETEANERNDSTLRSAENVAETEMESRAEGEAGVTDSDMYDEFHKYLLDVHAETQGFTTTYVDIFKFEEYESAENPSSVAANASIIEFWSSEQTTAKYPFLSKAANVIFATPCTQVSVERLFSALKFILSDHRMRTKGDLVNALMCIRVNYQLLERLKMLKF